MAPGQSERSSLCARAAQRGATLREAHTIEPTSPQRDPQPGAQPSRPSSGIWLALVGVVLGVLASTWWNHRGAWGPAADQRALDHQDSSAALPAPATAAAALAPAATAADAAAAATLSVAPPRPLAERGPLHISADPDQLRVWSNTKVRLKVEVDGDEKFSQFVWHFEDGSDPVVGVEVEHTFAESVRDRHVTVEGRRSNGPAVVASHTLAVERLAVVPLDKEADTDTEALPERQGTRILWVAGDGDAGVRTAVAEAASGLQVDAVVIAADVSDTTALDSAIAVQAPQAAVLAWSIDEPVAGGERRPLLQLLRDPGSAVSEVQIGDRASGVLAVRDLALVGVDTRGQTIDEAELKRLRGALQAAAAYTGSLLLSPRPLTQLTDGELIADRAYRLYEYALRQQISGVVSATSEVFYDGRFGGLAVVSVGRDTHSGCARILGHEPCQPPSITLVELGDHHRLKVLHLLAPDFDRAATGAELPAEAGKVRR